MKNTITINLPFESIVEFEASQKKIIQESLREIIAEKEKNNEVISKFLTRKQTANLLHISLPNLHSLTKSGRLKCRRINRRVLYDRDEVINALENVDPVPTKSAQ